MEYTYMSGRIDLGLLIDVILRTSYAEETAEEEESQTHEISKLREYIHFAQDLKEGNTLINFLPEEKVLAIELKNNLPHIFILGPRESQSVIERYKRFHPHLDITHLRFYIGGEYA